jgi:hypothetical protein
LDAVGLVRKAVVHALQGISAFRASQGKRMRSDDPDP